MRNFLFPAAAAAVLLTSAAAFAGTDTMTTGVIKSFSLGTHMLVLDSGVTYTLPTAFTDPGLKIGETVTIGWQMVNAAHAADSVVIVK